MKYTHIIWDFNGTVLDDLDICIESVNTLLRARGIKELESREAYRSVFGFPIIKYYEKIGFDFSKESFSTVAVEWVDQYMSRVPNAKTNVGVTEMLEAIRKNGAKNILISATELNMLKKQLSMLGISHLFDEVYGLDNIHAQNKVELAKEWRRANPNAKAIFVGDTDHDFESATAIGVECVLFADGHQSKEALSSFGCPMIESIGELSNIIF